MFFSSKLMKINPESKVLIRMSWDRNMFLTRYQSVSGILLMTFWDNFDARMKISWNFKIFSSGDRKFFKKSSEVNQRRFNISLETYFGLITFWWVFADISSFLWVMQCKRDFFSFCNFFSSKRKNHPTSERATAPYFWNFCKIWVSRNISMLRRVRTICRRTSYVHTEGTKIANVRHKNQDFSCILAMSYHSQKPVEIVIFSNFFFAKKYVKNPFEWCF